MSPRQEQFRAEVEAACRAMTRGDDDQAFAHLERAHILGQLRFADHVISHIWMLRFAWARQDGRELRGQALRILATVPGHLVGWLPIGNTGGANVSPFMPMPIPLDLQPYFRGFSLRRQIFRQALILSATAAVVGAWISN